MKLGVSLNTLNLQNFGVLESFDYAAQMGLDTVQLHRTKLKSAEPEYLRSIKEHADRLGLSIELMHGCIDRYGSNFHPERGAPEEQMRDAFDVARALGSPVFQVFMGNMNNRLDSVPFEQRLEGVAQAVQAV